MDDTTNDVSAAQGCFLLSCHGSKEHTVASDSHAQPGRLSNERHDVMLAAGNRGWRGTDQRLLNAFEFAHLETVEVLSRTTGEVKERPVRA
jgi:hypothetical protein